MYATFAFIGLFALGSVDAIVTGGADFGPSAAYAGEYRSAPVVMAAVTPASAAPIEDAAAVKAVLPEAVDYSVTSEVLLGGPEIVIGDDIVIEGLTAELASAL
ncbi:MAG: hypothetical protein AB7H66_16960 [Hyphomonadaceae bacterium]